MTRRPHVTPLSLSCQTNIPLSSIPGFVLMIPMYLLMLNLLLQALGMSGELERVGMTLGKISLSRHYISADCMC